jgi:hypothetical protein
VAFRCLRRIKLLSVTPGYFAKRYRQRAKRSFKRAVSAFMDIKEKQICCG